MSDLGLFKQILFLSQDAGLLWLPGRDLLDRFTNGQAAIQGRFKSWPTPFSFQQMLGTKGAVGSEWALGVGLAAGKEPRPFRQSPGSQRRQRACMWAIGRGVAGCFWNLGSALWKLGPEHADCLHDRNLARGRKGSQRPESGAPWPERARSAQRCYFLPRLGLLGPAALTFKLCFTCSYFWLKDCEQT